MGKRGIENSLDAKLQEAGCLSLGFQGLLGLKPCRFSSSDGEDDESVRDGDANDREIEKISTWARPGGAGLPPMMSDINYFVTMRLGSAEGAGAAGEIANVSHTFQPSGRFSAPNSL